jgi:hypothetical protein
VHSVREPSATLGTANSEGRFKFRGGFRSARQLHKNPGMRKALWLLALPLWPVAATASAQSEAVVVTSSEIQMVSASEAAAQAAEREQARRDAQAVRPRRGVILSSILAAGGAGMLGGGIVLSRICFGSTSCPDSGGVGAAGFGATLMVGSVVGLLISSVRLRRAKEGKPLRKKHRALP